MWSLSKTVLLALTLILTDDPGSSGLREPKMQHGKTTVISVRYLPDGKQFISASYDGTVIMWDTASGKRVWRLDLDEGTRTKKGYTISNVLGMDLSPDDIIAVSYSRAHVVGDTLQGKDEERIGLLDSKTGREIRVLTGHTALIGRLAFSPDGELLLSESGDNSARLWNVNTGQQELLIKLKERGASVAFSPDGKVFAVATQPVWGLPPQHIVGLYDARKGHLLREFPTKNAVTSLAFSPDGQSLAIASGDAVGAQIDVWQLTAQDSRMTFQMPRRNIKVVKFSTDGRAVALGGYGNGKGLVQLRSLSTNRPTGSFTFEEEVTALDFSPDGKQLVVGTDKGQIVLLQVQTR